MDLSVWLFSIKIHERKIKLGIQKSCKNTWLSDSFFYTWNQHSIATLITPSLLFSNNGQKNIVKTYEKLLSKNMSMRLKDDENGIKTYVLRANSHRYLAKLESNNFEIIYEL